MGIGTCTHMPTLKKLLKWFISYSKSSVSCISCKSFFWFFTVFPLNCFSSVYFLLNNFLWAIFIQNCCFLLDYFPSINCFSDRTFYLFQSSFLHVGFWRKWSCFIVLKEIVIKHFIHIKLTTFFTRKWTEPWLFPLFVKWGHFGKTIKKIMRPPCLKFWKIAWLPGWLRRKVIDSSFFLIWKNFISLCDLKKFPLCLLLVVRVFVRVPDNCQSLISFFDFLRVWISADS